MVVTGTHNLEKHPIGPEMCKMHCGQINKCTFCTFSPVMLVCIATQSKLPLETKGEDTVYLKIAKETKTAVAQRKELCTERQSRIILTRTNGFRCVKRSSTKEEKTFRQSQVKVTTRDTTRLLVAPLLETRKTSPIRAFHLLNSSITTYHRVKPNHFIAMAYVPSLKKLLVASYSPKRVISLSLHSGASVTIMKRMCVPSIAVDDGQQLVFLATESSYPCITIITPDGGHLKRISCKLQTMTLCLDTRRYLVYAADAKAIYSFTYDGMGFHRVTSAHGLQGLTLGENGDVIYYNNNQAIMELELTKYRKIKTLTEITVGRIKNILYNNGYLYISSNNIFVWHDSKCSLLRADNPADVAKQLIALIP